MATKIFLIVFHLLMRINIMFIKKTVDKASLEWYKQGGLFLFF
jgi:hypothetical protein